MQAQQLLQIISALSGVSPNLSSDPDEADFIGRFDGLEVKRFTRTMRKLYASVISRGGSNVPYIHIDDICENHLGPSVKDHVKKWLKDQLDPTAFAADPHKERLRKHTFAAFFEWLEDQYIGLNGDSVANKFVALYSAASTWDEWSVNWLSIVARIKSLIADAAVKSDFPEGEQVKRVLTAMPTTLASDVRRRVYDERQKAYEKDLRDVLEKGAVTTTNKLPDMPKSLDVEPSSLSELDVAIKKAFMESQRLSSSPRRAMPSIETQQPTNQLPAPTLSSISTPPVSLKTNVDEKILAEIREGFKGLSLTLQQFQSVMQGFANQTSQFKPPPFVDSHAFEKVKFCVWCACDHNLGQCMRFFDDVFKRGIPVARNMHDNGKVWKIRRNADGSSTFLELVPLSKEGMRAQFIKPSDDPAWQQEAKACKDKASKNSSVSMLIQDAEGGGFVGDSFAFTVDTFTLGTKTPAAPRDVPALSVSDINQYEVLAVVSNFPSESGSDFNVPVSLIVDKVRQQRNEFSHGEVTSAPVLRGRTREDLDVSWPPAQGQLNVRVSRKPATPRESAAPYVPPKSTKDPNAPRRSSEMATDVESPQTIPMDQVQRLIQEALDKRSKELGGLQGEKQALEKGNKAVTSDVPKTTGSPLKEVETVDTAKEEAAKAQKKLAAEKKRLEKVENEKRYELVSEDLGGRLLQMDAPRMSVAEFLTAARGVRSFIHEKIDPKSGAPLVATLSVAAGCAGLVEGLDTQVLALFQEFVRSNSSSSSPSGDILASLVVDNFRTAVVISECPRLDEVLVAMRVFARDVLLDQGSQINVVILSLVRKFARHISVQQDAFINMRSAQGAVRKLSGLALVPLDVYGHKFLTPCFILDDTDEAAPFDLLLGMPFVKHARLATYVDEKDNATYATFIGPKDGQKYVIQTSGGSAA
ncbi:hypothetical protein BCR33DRAFT_714377 [Rhizoclosmatium globosum]|uniref:Uncharacterized protein n=1 Tax=Rhizoclosmatium globosum TaxID=329046 RepID=A0A1Y2CNM3_9FUNG|nr:hypothetical protein BCR33DRAFT_714377 [Rhizoclosmatium globosum]|eukprot:ORY48639.1 hypothetical protein BCR33DRAFT_714377 [Rhizoclosmatium globosum]